MGVPMAIEGRRKMPKDMGLDGHRFDAMPPALDWLVAQAESRERHRGLAMVTSIFAGTGALAAAWWRAHLGL